MTLDKSITYDRRCLCREEWTISFPNHSPKLSHRIFWHAGYDKVDMGDWWAHEVRIEDRLKAEEGKRYPVCVGGQGTCPPEDCGGPEGDQATRGLGMIIGETVELELQDGEDFVAVALAPEPKRDPGQKPANSLNGFAESAHCGSPDRRRSGPPRMAFLLRYQDDVGA